MGKGSRVALLFAGAIAVGPATAGAQGPPLPDGYLVWSRGTADDPASRKIFRLTLPAKDDQRPLTSGEDIEPQVSPDGRWVAYAKAKFPGGSDYHDFRLWKVYVVSIHGAGQGRKEVKIDDEGAWPSWSKNGALFYNQADGTHSRLVRVELDEKGRVARRQVVLSTRDHFGAFSEVNEAFIAPDESWMAARTRGNATQNGVGAFTVNPPAHVLMARAGDIGCMPTVAPSGKFGIIAGAGDGIRWGHGPQVASRKEDQLLIPPRTPMHKAYHPGISSDERWVMSAQGIDADHNAGRYDVHLYPLDAAAMTIGEGQSLAAGDFNGWPHLWVGTPGPPPPPHPEIAELHASSYTVAPGEMVTLTWSTFGADQVALDGESVMADGTAELRPTATREHTLTARSSVVSTSETRTVAITVNATPVPVVVERFAAMPPKIEKGKSTILSWQVRNATTLELDGQRATPVETREVSPLETTTYVLTARGHDGPAQATVTVTVEPLKSGLLPDRGGFRCAIGHGGRAPASLLLPLLLLLGTAVARARLRGR